MTGRYLLDTNIVIGLLEGDEAVRSRLSQAVEVFVPTIVLGELYLGARKSARWEENVARIDDFASRAAVLAPDTEVARRYWIIKTSLREQGRPIPENDVWIAATAERNELTLVTRDTHFEQVATLPQEQW